MLAPSASRTGCSTRSMQQCGLSESFTIWEGNWFGVLARQVGSQSEVQNSAAAPGGFLRNCSGNLPSDSAVTWKLVLEWWNLQAASTNQFLGPTIAVAKYHTRHWATMSNLYFVQLDRRRAGARKATIPNAPKASTSLLRRPDWAHVFELVQSVHKSYHVPSPKLSAYQQSVTICKPDCAVPCYCHWTKDIR